MKFDETKLRKECSDISPLDLNNFVPIEEHEPIQIKIVHHPHGGSISHSASSCQIVGK